MRFDSGARTWHRDLSSSPKKRKADEDSELVALDLLLGDRTGPVMVTLWADLAKNFGDDVAEQRVRLPGPASFVVSLDSVEVASLPKTTWTGRCLTSMRVLHSLAPATGRVGTQVSIGNAPMSPFLTSGSFTVPPGEVWISRFSQVKSQCFAQFRGPGGIGFHTLRERISTLQAR